MKGDIQHSNNTTFLMGTGPASRGAALLPVGPSLLHGEVPQRFIRSSCPAGRLTVPAGLTICIPGAGNKVAGLTFCKPGTVHKVAVSTNKVTGRGKKNVEYRLTIADFRFEIKNRTEIAGKLVAYSSELVAQNINSFFPQNGKRTVANNLINRVPMKHD